jgi:hypothetical protein
LRIILFMPAAMPFPFVHLKLPITGAVDQCVLHLGAILAHNLVEAGIIYGRKDVRKTRLWPWQVSVSAKHDAESPKSRLLISMRAQIVRGNRPSDVSGLFRRDCASVTGTRSRAARAMSSPSAVSS